MAQNFTERLKKSPVLCDGAMGTLLYAKEEIVDLHTTKYGFEANLRTLKTEDEMLGSLFDILA